MNNALLVGEEETSWLRERRYGREEGVLYTGSWLKRLASGEPGWRLGSEQVLPVVFDCAGFRLVRRCSFLSTTQS